MKRRSKALIIVFIITLLIIGITGLIINNKNVNNLFGIFSSRLANSSQATTVQYLVYDNQNESSLKVLVQVANNNGIEYIQREDGSQLMCNNKNAVAFDVELALNVSKGNIQIKTINGVEQKELLITQDDMDSQLQIAVEKPDSDDPDNSTKIFTFYDMKKDTDKTYFRLNESDAWTTYSNDRFSIDDSIQDTDIYLKKEDAGGNILYSKRQAHIDIPNFITLGDITWQNEKAQITLTKGPEIIPNTTVEYLVKGTNQSTWTKMNENSETVTNLQNGNVIFIRLIDENNKVQATVSKTILDKTAPKDASIQYTKLKNGGTGEETNINAADETIRITAGDIIKGRITIEDDETGINLQKCRWQYSTKKTVIGTNLSDYPSENRFTNNTIEIEQQLSGSDGARYLHILSCDKAGNYKETIITNPIVVVTGGDGLDVFAVANASDIFEDITGSYISEKHRSNYKVGANWKANGGFSNVNTNWTTKVNASALFNELDIENISKFNIEFTWGQYTPHNGGRPHISGIYVYVKYLGDSTETTVFSDPTSRAEWGDRMALWYCKHRNYNNRYI